MIKKQLIVSVSGIIGSGKDTVGDYLVTNYGFKRISFGSALKDAVAAIFNWERELLDGLTDESRKWRTEIDHWWTERLDLGINITPRWVLVNFGTEVMRHHFHSDIWVLSVENQIARYDDHVVITDARFLNELASVRIMNGIVLGIHRNVPPWLNPFYKGMEKAYIGQHTGHPEHVSLLVPENRDLMVSAGHQVMKGDVRREDQVHESEWQHVLWNDYDAMINNTGSRLETYKQIEQILKSHM
jgi:hypothetical protein